MHRSLVLLSLVACLFPTSAAAQTPIAVMPPDIRAPLMNASGSHVVVATDQRLTADDTDGIIDIYVYTVAGGAWRRLPRALLVGRHEQVDSSELQPLSLSDDGRYLAYVTRRLRPFDVPAPPVLARFDIATSTRLVIRDAAFDAFALPVMSRDGSTMAWLGDRNAVIVATVGQTPLTVGQACPVSPSPLTCERGPQVSARGDRVLYLVGQAGGFVPADRLEVFDRATNRTTMYPEFRPFFPAIGTTATGDHVYAMLNVGTGVVFDLGRRTSEPIATTTGAPPLVISDDARFVLLAAGQVHDRRASSVLGSGGDASLGLSSDGRIIAVVLPGGPFALLDLDGDADGMRDPWETLYGLDPSSRADGDLDADGDGVTNRDEFAQGSHPRATHRRYFAEGVTSPFFQTTLYTFSNVRVPRAPITITFTTDDGRRASRALTGRSLDGLNQATLPPILGTTAAYSITVESDVPFAAERVTTWPAAGPPVGAHASSGTATPAVAWTFAEGATRAGLQTFLLLANPGPIDAEVSVAYLCASQARVGRTHRVPARGRTTVWVNQEGAPLDAAECGAELRSDQPIVAERSMYLAGPTGFTAGTSSTGVSSVDTSAVASPHTWYFPAGATADPFDMFLTLVNTSPTPCPVEVTYTLPVGPPIARTHLVPASARLTIWADHEDPRLAQAGAVATQVRCPTGLVFAERAMWWRAPGGSAWIEGHVERGSLAPATTWAMAHVPESATIAILNPTSGAGVAKVTMYAKNGIGAAERVLTLPPGLTEVRPTDLWPALGPDRYSATVESLPVGAAPPVPLIVERTAYIPGTPAGTTVLGTPLP